MKVCKPVIIEGRPVGHDVPPLIVAEMSGNHGGSLDVALKLVDAVAEAGAHALKLQTYTADTMTLDVDGPGFVVEEPGSLWRGERLYDLYQRAATPWDWHSAIFERCRAHGLIVFSTPFDETAVDFLEGLNVPCYKISSFECTDVPLIRRVACTGKPVIVSTGMASESEIVQAVTAASEAGCRELILLKCTSTYPALPDDINLLAIPEMARCFDCPVGLSDHTLGIGVALAAVALGAVMIEKHVTLSRADGAVDAGFSLEPHELAALVTESERAWRAMGEAVIGCAAGERPSLAYRRSLYVAKDVAQGDVLTTANVRAVRPGYGLPPIELDRVLGCFASRPLRKGEPLAWDCIADEPAPVQRKAP